MKFSSKGNFSRTYWRIVDVASFGWISNGTPRLGGPYDKIKVRIQEFENQTKEASSQNLGKKLLNFKHNAFLWRSALTCYAGVYVYATLKIDKKSYLMHYPYILVYQLTFYTFKILVMFYNHFRLHKFIWSQSRILETNYSWIQNCTCICTLMKNDLFVGYKKWSERSVSKYWWWLTWKHSLEISLETRLLGEYTHINLETSL